MKIRKMLWKFFVCFCLIGRSECYTTCISTGTCQCFFAHTLHCCPATSHSFTTEWTIHSGWTFKLHALALLSLSLSLSLSVCLYLSLFRGFIFLVLPWLFRIFFLHLCVLLLEFSIITLSLRFLLQLWWTKEQVFSLSLSLPRGVCTVFFL